MSTQLYAQAASSGIQAIGTMMGGKSAQTIAAYNTAYNEQYQKYAALESKSVAESNVSAINQDKVLSNISIQIQQQQAEASAQLSAAVAGVSGSSVDTSMYQIDANASTAIARADAQAEQLTEQQLATINSAQTTYNSVPKTAEPSAMAGALSGLAQTVGNIKEEDWKQVGSALETWSK